MSSLFEVLTLYRGDTDRVDKFDAKGGNKVWADMHLYGAGLYLTDTKSVADEYSYNNHKMVVGTGHDLKSATIDAIYNLSEKEWKETIERIKAEMREKHGYFTTSEVSQSDYKSELTKARDALVKKTKADIKAMGLEGFKKPDGTVLLVKPSNRSVSRFVIPDEIEQRIFDADASMTDSELEYVGNFLFGNDRHDLRAYDPTTREEKNQPTFTDWVRAYKKYGARYAWSSNTIGGTGENPTFDEVTHGTHGGITRIYDLNKTNGNVYAKLLRDLGYVGLTFKGGIQGTGTGMRGGGSVPHRTYVIYDQNVIDQILDGDDDVPTPIEQTVSNIQARTVYRV